MITYDDVISLGWVNRNLSKRKDHEKSCTFKYKDNDECNYIMSVHFCMYEQDDLSQAMIKYVHEGVVSNVWENSECWFYGNIKTKEDLQKVMMFLDIIEYE